MINAPFERHQSGLIHVSKGLMKHGIGLRKKPRYKLGLAARQSNRGVGLYDLTGNNYYSVMLDSPFNRMDHYKFCPSKGLMGIGYRESSTTGTPFNIKIYDIVSKSLLRTYTFQIGNTYAVNFDFTEKGELVVWDSSNAVLSLYNTDGTLKNSIDLGSSLSSGLSGQTFLALSKKFVAIITSPTQIRILSINDLSLVLNITKLSTEYLYAFDLENNVLTSSSGTVRKRIIDYNTKTLVETLSYNVASANAINNVVPFKDKVFVCAMNTSATASSTIVELTDRLILIKENTINSIVQDVDNDYIFAVDYASPYTSRLYRLTNKELLLSVNSGALAYFNDAHNVSKIKGTYAVFNKYW